MIIKLPNPLYSVAFDKTAKTVTISGLGNVDSAIPNRIYNVTAGVEIYGSASGKKGTVVKTVTPDQIVITLAYDTSAMNNTDVLEVSMDCNPDEVNIDATAQQVGVGTAVSSVDLGSKTDAAATTDTGTFSLIALFKRLLTKLTGGIIVFGSLRGPISDSFARPNDTTAYAAGDAVQDSTSAPATRKFTSLLPNSGGTGYLSIAAVIRNTSITPKLRLHLFNADPGTKANDNAAFTVATGDEAKYLGYIDLDAMNTGLACSSNRKEVVLSGADLFYQVQTLDAFTPTAQTNYLFKATLDSNV